MRVRKQMIPWLKNSPARLAVLLLIISFLWTGNAGVASAQGGVFLPQLTGSAAQDADFNVEYTVPAEYRAKANAVSSASARAAVPPLPWYDDAASAPLDEPVQASADLGEPKWSNGGLPDVGADAVAQALYADAWAAIEAAELAEATALTAAGAADQDPGVNYSGSTHTSFRANAYGQMWQYYPYRAIGKVYLYEDVEGSLQYAGYCSGAVMGERNLVATAGHCLYDQDDPTDPWYDAWEFVPADRNGGAPYGSWWATNAMVRGPWTMGGGRNYDVGLLSLEYKWVDSAWRPVSYFTGWLGRVLNVSYLQHLFAFGYPSNLESGAFSYGCAAESYFGGALDYISMGCNMTFGSSGGPWIWKFSPNRGWQYNYLVSVVSGGVPGSEVFTGPRFSDDNIGSLCTDWPCGVEYPRP